MAPMRWRVTRMKMLHFWSNQMIGCTESTSQPSSSSLDRPLWTEWSMPKQVIFKLAVIGNKSFLMQEEDNFTFACLHLGLHLSGNNHDQLLPGASRQALCMVIISGCGFCNILSGFINSGMFHAYGNRNGPQQYIFIPHFRQVKEGTLGRLSSILMKVWLTYVNMRYYYSRVKKTVYLVHLQNEVGSILIFPLLLCRV